MFQLRTKESVVESESESNKTDLVSIAAKPSKPIAAVSNTRVTRFLGSKEIKRWTPLYDTIVVYYLRGLKKTKIARKLGICYSTVFRVTNSPRAKRQIDKFRERAINLAEKDLYGKMLQIDSKASEIVLDFMHNKQAAKADPFRFAEFAIKAQKNVVGTKIANKEPGVTNNIQNAIMIQGDQLKGLLETLKVSEGPLPQIGNVDTTSTGKVLKALANG